METKSTSLTKWAMTYGLYLGIFHIVVLMILYFREQLFTNVVSGYVVAVFVVGILWFGMTNYRDKVNGGVLSYGKGVGIGVMIALFGAIFASVTIYILMTFDPSLSTQYLNVLEQAAAQSGLADDMIDSMMKMYEIITRPGIMAFSKLLGLVFWGTIASLIIAAIVKKVPEDGFYNAVKDID